MAVPVVTGDEVRKAGTVARRSQAKKLTFDKVSFMVVFLGLPLAIFLIFVIWPVVQAVYYSLTDWGGFTSTFKFIGLNNYKKLWNDDIFRQALLNNIKLGIVVPLVTIVLALILASLVTVAGSSRGNVRGIKASSFYRVISFFPYCIPAIVIGLIWAQVYDPNAGALNGILTGIGLERFQGFAWLGVVASRCRPRCSSSSGASSGSIRCCSWRPSKACRRRPTKPSASTAPAASAPRFR